MPVPFLLTLALAVPPGTPATVPPAGARIQLVQPEQGGSTLLLRPALPPTDLCPRLEAWTRHTLEPLSPVRRAAFELRQAVTPAEQERWCQVLIAGLAGLPAQPAPAPHFALQRHFTSARGRLFQGAEACLVGQYRLAAAHTAAAERAFSAAGQVWPGRGCPQPPQLGPAGSRPYSR
jgi:hypothetical protein